MEWKLLRSEYLFKEPWLTVRRDECALPDGRIVYPYYVLEYPDWANAMAVTEDDKVVLIRQFRQGIGKVLLEIPGGVIDATDTTPEEAMKRELLEETGYAFTEIYNIGAVSHNPSTSNNLTHMFLATGGKKVQEQQLDHNEEIEVVVVDMEELERLLKEHQFLQALHISCLFYGLQKYRELKAAPLPQ